MNNKYKSSQIIVMWHLFSTMTTSWFCLLVTITRPQCETQKRHVSFDVSSLVFNYCVSHSLQNNLFQQKITTNTSYTTSLHLSVYISDKCRGIEELWLEPVQRKIYWIITCKFPPQLFLSFISYTSLHLLLFFDMLPFL